MATREYKFKGLKVSVINLIPSLKFFSLGKGLLLTLTGSRFRRSSREIRFRAKTTDVRYF